jgi:hypothetical protein
MREAIFGASRVKLASGVELARGLFSAVKRLGSTALSIIRDP